TVPAALMALARVDRPAVVLYSGPMRAGPGGVTIQDVWEAIPGPRAALDELERVACPGAGTCAGHFTANTMAVALDFLGLARLGDGLVPADELERKQDAARAAGELAVTLQYSARRFLDKRALLNAMAGIVASGGSTNGLLHLLALAREADVALLRELIRGGLVDGSSLTVGGATLAEATVDAADPDGDVLHPLERPFKPSG